METNVYNDLMEIIEKQDSIIKMQKMTLESASRLIELKDQRIKVLEKMIEILK